MVRSIAAVADTMLNAVSDALSLDLRPVCKTYQSVGLPMIFSCCECEGGSNGELSLHFRRLFDADPSNLIEVQRVRPCKGGVIAAQYRMVLARCAPIIDEHGEIPDPDDQTDASDEQARDVELLWQALACSGLNIRIDDISIDGVPQGGCSVVFADITVQVDIPALPVDFSG